MRYAASLFLSVFGWTVLQVTTGYEPFSVQSFAVLAGVLLIVIGNHVWPA